MTKEDLTAAITDLIAANDSTFVAGTDPTTMAKKIHEYFWSAFPEIRALNDIANRGYVVDLICTYLRSVLTDFHLVKPYHGELDRFHKKKLFNEDNFPAEVQIATPFALVVSSDRPVQSQKGHMLRVKHEFSIYIGDANPNDFSIITAPNIFTLMKKCLEAMHAQHIVQGAGEVMTVSDGEYFAATPLFTVYEQKYYQMETIF